MSASVAGLSEGASYYYRILAKNGAGTEYSRETGFSTLPLAPEIGYADSGPTTNSVTLRGTVNPNGSGVTNCYFEYGATEAYGQVIPCSALPGMGTSPVAVSATVTGLAVNTSYHYQLVATNSIGTTEGQDRLFGTLLNSDSNNTTVPAVPAKAKVAELEATASGGTGTITVGRYTSNPAGPPKFQAARRELLRHIRRPRQQLHVRQIHALQA